MAAVRRHRDVQDNMSDQDENYKSNSIQLRSKGTFEEPAQMKAAITGNGKPMATRLSRQQRGVMTDIGNNQNQVHTVKNRAYMEAFSNKENNHVMQNTAISCKNEKSVHQSIIEEPKAKRKYNGENSTKPSTEIIAHESCKELEDINMASPVETSKDPRSNFIEPGDVSMDDACHTERSKIQKLMPLVAVADVDEEDSDDPQMVSVYVNDIFAYMRLLEIKHAINENYLRGKKGVILPKMRAVLTDWMVEVHQQFSLLQETLYLSVAILDRYMQEAAENVHRKKLQLVGVTAMFIAAKYEEMYAPEIGDFVYITDNAYSESQIREQEIEMITHLDFNLERPLPLHFLRRYSKVAQVDTTVHNLAKYIMELTVVEYKFCHVLPSKVAAASLAISMVAFEQDPKKGLRQIWNQTLEHYTFYSLTSIAELIQQLAGNLLKVSRASDSARIMAVRKKYLDKKFLRVSASPEVTGLNVIKLAEGQFC